MCTYTHVPHAACACKCKHMPHMALCFCYGDNTATCPCRLHSACITVTALFEVPVPVKRPVPPSRLLCLYGAFLLVLFLLGRRFRAFWRTLEICLKQCIGPSEKRLKIGSRPLVVQIMVNSTAKTKER